MEGSPRPTIENFKLCCLCSSESCSSACICDGAIKLIGNRCLTAHLKESSKVHDLIDLDLALRMSSDFDLFNKYLTETIEISRFLNLLKLHSSKLKRSRKQLSDEQSYLYTKIQEVFKEVDLQLEEMDQETNFKIRVISDYKRNLYGEGASMMQVYKEEGFEKLIPYRCEEFKVPADLIAEYVRNSISLEHSYDIERFRIEEEQVKRLKSLTENNEEYEKEIQEMSSQLEELRLEIFSKDAVIDEYKESINKLKTQVNQLMLDYDKSMASIAKLKRIVYDKSNSESHLKKEIKRMGKILKAQDSKTLSEFQEYKQFAETELQQLTESHSIATRTNLKLQSDLESVLIRLSRAESQFYSLSNLIRPESSSDLDEHYRTFSGKRYIYYPNSFSKDLIQYDIRTLKSSVIPFEDLDRDFNSTSTCELPNGDIMIAGFQDPLSNEAYLYMVSLKEFIELPNMHYPRCFISLYYYRDYVYAFGGVDSNKAERFNIYTKSWEKLKNMKYARSSLSCVGVGEKIYLFKGKEREIEVFNIPRKKFERVYIDNSENFGSVGLAYRLDDVIYLITQNLVQVYDTQLKKLNQLENTFKQKQYTITNLVTYSSNLYYLNYHTYLLHSIPSSLKDFSPKKHAINHYKKHLNRYIYKPRENSKLLHRVDLKYSTTEVINLSNSIDRNFLLTSICLIDTGEIFIAGFDDPISSECFLYDPANNIIHRMPSMNLARCYTGLVYYSDHIYAFGGISFERDAIKDAEKLNINRRISWVEVSDMIHARSTPACIAVDGRVYIFGGDVNSVEVYDIDRNIYEMINTVLESELVVAGMGNEKIYVIGEWYYMVGNKDMEVEKEDRDRWNRDGCTFTQGNVVYYDDCIVFFNEGNHILEKIKCNSFERNVQIIEHRVSS